MVLVVLCLTGGNLEEKTLKRFILITLLILLSAISFLDWIESISDSDFFWHIATGRWIIDNKTLPEADPFSFTSPEIRTTREKFILTSYWLSQVVYYLLYSLLGYPGIMLLRVLIALSIMYFLFKRLSRKGVEPIIQLPLIILTVLIFIMNYKWERPQAFSFAFFGILLYLLDESKDRKKYVFYIIPLLMLLWANMHGGFIIGQGVLFIYIISEVANRFISGVKINKGLILTSIIGILIAFINPNIYGAIRETLTTESSITENISEFMSTVEFFKFTGALQIPLYWLILITGSIAILYRIRKGTDVKDVLLFCIFGYFSFVHVRYIAFFVIFAIPLIGDFFSSIRWKKVVLASLVSVSIITCVVVEIRYNILMNIKNINAFAEGNFVSPFYPEQSVNFITENIKKKRIYNFYDWGGYLIWRLYPEKAVFIDGRQLHENAFLLSQAIDNAVIEPYIAGIPYWKAILKSYNIDCVIIPAFRKFGDVIPLFKELLFDDEWAPVFYQENSVVFVKRIPENFRITYIYSRQREFVLNYMINFVNRIIQQSPYLVGFHIAKGDLLQIVGRFYEAEQAYRRALELFPFHGVAQQRLEELRMFREGRR